MNDLEHSALLTDLYQLTMLHAYWTEGMEEIAVFELFFRKLPPQRGYLIAAGLEQALDFLERLYFTQEELEWLRGTGLFAQGFIDYLATLRFRGDVEAMAEGTVFFPDEPILRVIAPLPQAQLVESRLINILHYQTLIASKAARCALLAPDKLLVDFGLRRAHGAEAGLYAARASYLAGFAGSATVLAGARYGIPVYGTMAHSYVQAHRDELQAFERFARANPDNVVLLIDTYDTEAAARKLIPLAHTLARDGIKVKGVRIDSGDLARHARAVRVILDEGGLRDITIFASGSVDEYMMESYIADGVPIDGYGIGTHLDTSADAPYLDCAYKLQEYAGVARRKRSEGKATWPGRKQVYRHYRDDGSLLEDLLTVQSEPAAGTPLIQPVMRGGRRLAPSPALADLRAVTSRNLHQLPNELRRLHDTPPYPVHIAPALHALAAEVDAACSD